MLQVHQSKYRKDFPKYLMVLRSQLYLSILLSDFSAVALRACSAFGQLLHPTGPHSVSVSHLDFLKARWHVGCIQDTTQTGVADPLFRCKIFSLAQELIA